MATAHWHRSGDLQWRQSVAEPAYSATAEFFEGGTTTPLVVYNDAAAGISLGSTVTVDGAARWPDVFIQRGSNFGYRIKDGDGTIIRTVEMIENPVIPESSDGPTPVAEFPTGFVATLMQTGTLAGWVQVNGKSIGSSASAATERANDDTQNLYTYVWTNLPDSVAPVAGGRGGSAAADFAANKPITLPDGRGATLRGIDTMGNIDLASLANTPFTKGNSTTVGSEAGANSLTMTVDQLPTHTHGAADIVIENESGHTHAPGSYIAAAAGGHAHTQTPHQHTSGQYRTGIDIQDQGGGNTRSVSWITAGETQVGTTVIAPAIQAAPDHTHPISGASAAGSAHSHATSGNTNPTGDGDPINNAGRSILVTIYMKL